MENNQVVIKKVENGYIVSVEDNSQSREKQFQAFRKLLEISGAIESWQEDKLREVEELFKDSLGVKLPPSTKSYIFKTLEEVVSFLYVYFKEVNPPSKI